MNANVRIFNQGSQIYSKIYIFLNSKEFFPNILKQQISQINLVIYDIYIFIPERLKKDGYMFRLMSTIHHGQI